MQLSRGGACWLDDTWQSSDQESWSQRSTPPYQLAGKLSIGSPVPGWLSAHPIESIWIAGLCV